MNLNNLAEKNILVWMRRDLRTHDHSSLAAALSHGRKIWCLFVFDEEILEPLRSAGRALDRRVEFIHHALVELDKTLRKHGGGLIVRHGTAAKIVPAIASELAADVVVANRDYESRAIKRDLEVSDRLSGLGIRFVDFKDQVVFEKSELLAGTGNFYSVYTPYKRAWLKALSSGDFAERITFASNAHGLTAIPPKLDLSIPTLADLGFQETNLLKLGIPLGESGASALLEEFVSRMAFYGARRDFPFEKGPSYLSVHLRFGTISVRTLVRAAMHEIDHSSDGEEGGAATWLSELIWRDFFSQILFHRPDVEQHPFRREYDSLEWIKGPQSKAYLTSWIEGKTGYPIVDAAMRQIATTGYMHNRLRMITASFLVKNLGVDWRLGEEYFALLLNDFDLASNNGNWQWAASTGCDAQPYFRIFNPILQSRKFDSSGQFIQSWLPELADSPAEYLHEPWNAPPSVASHYLGAGRYPLPIVDLAATRALTMARYAKARKI